ncbi:hypothetical protein KY316_02940 [Candidatus Woesearchaeota archaeon]|nr:hypothetical protein [Candidatus Woesearchaeota archaeon]
MKNKAQFYLLGILAICVVVFVLLQITPAVTYGGSYDSFTKLWQNYYSESVVVVDQAVTNNYNLFSHFQDYTDDFKTYSKSIDAGFGFVYVLTDSKLGTRVRNELESDADVLYKTNSSSSALAKGSQATVDSKFVNISIDGNEYEFDTTAKNRIQLLFYEKTGEDIRIRQVI